MEEKLKITGKGILNTKEYGNIKINNKESDIHSKIIYIYDKKSDQYCVNGQWELPFHR